MLKIVKEKSDIIVAIILGDAQNDNNTANQRSVVGPIMYSMIWFDLFQCVFARIERGQGADLGKGHFYAWPTILRALLRVILHFEGTMGK